MWNCEVCFLNSNDSAEVFIKLKNCKHCFCFDCLVNIKKETLLTTLEAVTCPIDQQTNKYVTKTGDTEDIPFFDYVQFTLKNNEKYEISLKELAREILENYIKLNKEKARLFDEIIEHFQKCMSMELSIENLKVILVGKCEEYYQNDKMINRTINRMFVDFNKTIQFYFWYGVRNYRQMRPNELPDVVFGDYDFMELNDLNIEDYLDFLKHERSIICYCNKFDMVCYLFNSPLKSCAIEYFEQSNCCPLCQTDISKECEFVMLKNSQVKICLNCCCDTFIELEKHLDKCNSNKMQKMFLYRIYSYFNQWYNFLRNYLVTKFNLSEYRDIVLGNDKRQLIDDELIVEIPNKTPKIFYPIINSQKHFQYLSSYIKKLTLARLHNRNILHVQKKLNKFIDVTYNLLHIDLFMLLNGDFADFHYSRRYDYLFDDEVNNLFTSILKLLNRKNNRIL